MLNKQKVSKESKNLLNERFDFLKKAFPEVFTEGKIDFNRLKSVLGEQIIEKDEKYSFTWSGRSDAFKNIQTTAKGTLNPSKEESVNWDSTPNLFIEGDNLEVLKLLQKSYFNKIKMIYIDPPYNTGKDFVYKDNFKDSIKSYMEQTGQSKDGLKLTTNPETNGRYHSDWLSMMYPRLFVARNLLKEDGVIFVSIDDNEVHNLRMIMNEIFGEENFIANVIWEKKYSPSNDSKVISDTHDHIIVYAKNLTLWHMNLLPRTKEMNSRYINLDNDPRGVWKPGGLSAKTYNSKYDYAVKTTSGKIVNPPTGSCWQVSKERLMELINDNRIYFGKNGDSKPQIKQFLSEVQQGVVPKTIWFKDEVGHGQTSRKELTDLFGHFIFDNPKPIKLISRILSISTNKDSNDIIIDFFAGSGTTAHAVLDLNKQDGANRRFICVQLPEPTDKKSEAYKEGYKTIAEISKERIRRAIKQLNSKEGFKVFKLEKSNYKMWENYEGNNVEELRNQLKLFKDSLIQNYKEENVIYECIIKEGYSLNSKIEKLTIKSNKVYKITGEESSFYITLDSELNQKTIEELNLKKENVFICLDEALTDSSKKNLSLQCNLKVI